MPAAVRRTGRPGDRDRHHQEVTASAGSAARRRSRRRCRAACRSPRTRARRRSHPEPRRPAAPSASISGRRRRVGRIDMIVAEQQELARHGPAADAPARSRSPTAGPAGSQRLAGGDPQRLARGDRADLLRVQAGLEREPQLRRAPRPASGRTARRRRTGSARRAPARTARAGRPASTRRVSNSRFGRSAATRQIQDRSVTPACARISRAFGNGRRQRDRVHAERGNPTPGVDQDRQRALVGEPEQRRASRDGRARTARRADAV